LTAVRIVSLLPGATEIVCALGAGEALVGVSHECDHPLFVRGLPAVTRPKLDVHRASVAIDTDVRRLVAEGLGVYEIDVARLAALRPDVIVTQHQCEVCAVSYAEVEAAAQVTLGTDVRIVSRAEDVHRRLGRRAGRGRARSGIAGRWSRARSASRRSPITEGRRADGRLRRVARPADVGGALDVGACMSPVAAIRLPTSARGAASSTGPHSVSPTSSC
jgi:hypothetical protein